MDLRRRENRLPIRLEITWDEKACRVPTVTCDISVGGCYVQWIETMSVGDVLSFNIAMPNGSMLRIAGRVCYYQPTIGFGVSFINTSPQQLQTLQNLVEGTLEAPKRREHVNVQTAVAGRGFMPHFTY